jgi:predicted acylesterase/phospholipase RssA
MPRLPELRIALAMRGGVSLAVWMGGACSEVDALRRSSPDDPDPSLYAQLLKASGYGSVAVDAVAGASAGGLNSVLMACSIVYGTPFDAHIRNIWLRLGDIGALARPWGLRTPQSVLDGDGRFFAPLLAALERLTPAAKKDAPVLKPRLDLNLTGTLFNSVESARYPDLGDPIVETRNRARFRFRHLPMARGQESLSDFDAADRSVVLAQLAYAARATSSFPGAFEPASVGYAAESRPPAGSKHLPPTHYGVFSESRPLTDHGRDLVIDGGVLDNIPVAWAIRSIAAAPADRPIDRWLVYLQPVPFDPPVPPSREAPGLRETVKRALALQRGTEKLGDDIDELTRLQTESLVRDGFRQVLEYALGQLPEGEQHSEFLDKLFERAMAGAEVYNQRVGAIEANRLRRLWTDPMPVLGADPLGFSELGPIRNGASDASRLLQSLREVDLGEFVLGDVVVDHRVHGGDPVGGGDSGDSLPGRTEALRLLCQRIRTPQALARTVMLLLDTARELEEDGYEIKGALYGLRSSIELTVARHDRLLTAEPCRQRGSYDAAELARRAAWRLADQAQDAKGQAQQAEGQAQDADGRTGDGWPHDPFRAEWEQLTAFALELAAIAHPAPGPDGTTAARSRHTPSRAFVSCLVGAAADTADPKGAVAAVLMAVELLTGPLRPDPFPESSRVRFHMMSALNPTPLKSLRGPGGRQLRVREKLAGDQLANFGAFLSARWRLNDWVWGRLDAATSLVKIVLAPQAGHQPGPDLRALAEIAGVPAETDPTVVTNALIARLHEQILREELPLFATLRTGPPPADPESPPQPQGSDLDVEPLLGTGRETVGALMLRNPRLWAAAGKIGAGAGRAWVSSLVSGRRDRSSAVW